jgi:uncharacterized membrane protein
MSILSDLSELVNARVISRETAMEISNYYKNRQESSPTGKNRQLLMFGILGAVLVGIGLLFIIANQWDDLSRGVKTTCAFLLLVIPQLLGLYALYKKADKPVWRESTALLLFFAVGANISLVSQIYQINGEASSFLLTWLLLTIPLVYLMDASAVSIACLIGVLSYRLAVDSEGTVEWGEQISLALFLVLMPRYISLFKKAPDNQLTILHHWAIPFVLTAGLAVLSHDHKELLIPLYFMLFGIFIFIGELPFFRHRPQEHCGFRVFGYAGSIIVLFVLSFKSIWEKLPKHHYELGSLPGSSEFIALALFFITLSILFYRHLQNRTLKELRIFEIAWLLFLPVFILGYFTIFPVYLVNLSILIMGVIMIRDGSKKNNLGTMNGGMILITMLLVCRSFDIDLTSLFKGILFVVVGCGFFIANWWMLKKRREHEA